MTTASIISDPAGNPARWTLADFGRVRESLACTDRDPDLFFSEAPDDVRRATAICLSCPFVAECRQYAIETGQSAGVWGAMTPEERANAKRKLARDGERRCPICGAAPPPRHLYDKDECRELARAAAVASAEERRRNRRPPSRARRAALHLVTS